MQAGWDLQQTRRWCNGSWVACADASDSTEHSLRLDWNGRLGDELTARAGASAARRTVRYDESAFLARVPMAGQTPAGATGALAGSTAYGSLLALGLTGYGPLAGLQPVAPAGSALAFYFPANNVLANALYGNNNRISELIGLRRYNQADRDRQTLRAQASWQASERWTLQGGIDASSDHYTHSVYGLQRVSSGAVNLDASYALAERIAVNLFSSFEQRRTRSAGNSYTANSSATSVNGATAISGGCFATIALRNASSKIDPCLDWQARQAERNFTFGSTVALGKLLAGRLDLSGSLLYSEGRSSVDVTGGSYVNNPFAGIAGAPTRDIAATFVPASALPTSVVRLWELRLAGAWHIGERQALRLAYGLQRLRSSDWADEGLQDGGLTQVLPTREQAPRHSIHSVGLSFATRF